MRRPQDGSAEWYTPAHVMEAVRHAFGGIDLDPFSCAEANGTVRAARYIDREEDGLIADWLGARRVWANPPYGSEIAMCIQAICEHVWRHSDAVALVLLPPNVDTGWWQDLVGARAERLLMLRGRLQFGATGNPKGSMIVMYAGRNTTVWSHEVWVRLVDRLPGTDLAPRTRLGVSAELRALEDESGRSRYAADLAAHRSRLL